MCSFSGICMDLWFIGNRTSFWTWDLDGFYGDVSGYFLKKPDLCGALRTEAVPGSAHETSCTGGVFPIALGEAG